MEDLETDRVARLLLDDALPTLGVRARAEVQALVANYAELAKDWARQGQSPAEVQRAFDRAVVDGLQQTAHDLFWDTTWPACPVHGRHPLWFDEERQVWCCARKPDVALPLGSLGAS